MRSAVPLAMIMSSCCSHCTSSQVYNSYRFGFDRVYGPESTQEDVYSQSARGAVHNVLQVRQRRAAGCWCHCLAGGWHARLVWLASKPCLLNAEMNL